jgi:hypothetical protein
LKPTIVLHYCDNDIWFALLTNQADIDRAMSIEKNIPANPDMESILGWFETLDFDMFGRHLSTELPPLPEGAIVLTFFGY